MTDVQVPWRRIVVSAYGPTLMATIGFGAIVPLIPLMARNLGASLSLAALVTAGLGLGQLVGDLPAGWVASRLGDRWAIVLACLVDAVALVSIFGARTLPVMALAVFVQGMAASVFGLARQTYLTEAIPVRFRARAMSSLGGVFRIGLVIGPLLGAAIVARSSLGWAFVFAAGMSLVAAAVTLALPDLPAAPHRTDRTAPAASTWGVFKQHSGVFATAGLGVFGLMLVRSARMTLLPLWSDSAGLSAAATSVIFAISMAFDVLLFFPGGAVMDRWGRWWVGVPTLVILGLGFAILPFTHTAVAITMVAAVLGIGNGVSSGIVMTLGSDFSPTWGRPQFLAGWRLFADAGQSAGPLVITAVSAVASLALASGVLFVLAWLAAIWLGRSIPGQPGWFTALARSSTAMARVTTDE